MTRKQKLLMLIVVLFAALSMLACYSTGCMTNDELVNYLDTGTAQPCFNGD